MAATEHAVHLATLIGQAAADKLGKDIVAYDMSDQMAITDVFVLISATNERQVGAIMDAIEEKLIKEENERPARREGDREKRWVLLDYREVVVHVQHLEEREFYALERLWRDCPVIPMELDEAPQEEETPAQSRYWWSNPSDGQGS